MRLIPIANGTQITQGAARLLPDANFLAVPQHRDVEVEQNARIMRQQRKQDVVRRFRRSFLADQTQANADAVQMRIDRQNRLMKAEQQHQCRGFHADARQRSQPLQRFLRRQIAQEIDVRAAAFADNEIEYSFDVGRFDCGKVGRRNRLDEFIQRRVADGFPTSKALPHLRESFGFVGFGRAVRKHRRNQFVQSFAARREIRLAVHLQQQGVNFRRFDAQSLEIGVSSTRIVGHKWVIKKEPQ